MLTLHRARKVKLDTACNALQEELGLTKHEVSRLTDAYSAQRAQNVGLENRVAVAGAELQVTKAESGRAKNAIDALEAELTRTKPYACALEAMCAATSAELAAKTATSDQELQELGAANQQLAAKEATAAEQLAVAEARLAELESQCSIVEDVANILIWTVKPPSGGAHLVAAGAGVSVEAVPTETLVQVATPISPALPQVDEEAKAKPAKGETDVSDGRATDSDSEPLSAYEDDGDWVPEGGDDADSGVDESASSSARRKKPREEETPPYGANRSKKQRRTTSGASPTGGIVAAPSSVRNQRVEALLEMMDDVKPWDAMYSKRVRFSYTFDYKSLAMTGKGWVDCLVLYQFKHRRVLWERQHWVSLAHGKTASPEMTTERRSRERRQAAALKEWEMVRVEGGALLVRGVLSKDMWQEPFM